MQNTKDGVCLRSIVVRKVCDEIIGRDDEFKDGPRSFYVVLNPSGRVVTAYPASVNYTHNRRRRMDDVVIEEDDRFDENGFEILKLINN